MKPNIGLTDERREGVVKILNETLADEYVLFTKTYKYHWNVRGKRFHDLHDFFEQQYKSLFAIIDETAERVRFLGEFPIGTLQEFVQTSKLREDPENGLDPQTMIKNLLKDHEALAFSLRGSLEDCAHKFQDAGSADYLTALMQKHEKTAWMLRSSLEDM